MFNVVRAAPAAPRCDGTLPPPLRAPVFCFLPHRTSDSPVDYYSQVRGLVGLGARLLFFLSSLLLEGRGAHQNSYSAPEPLDVVGNAPLFSPPICPNHTGQDRAVVSYRHLHLPSAARCEYHGTWNLGGQIGACPCRLPRLVGQSWTGPTLLVLSLPVVTITCRVSRFTK